MPRVSRPAVASQHRVLLRLPADLHRTLAAAASEAGVSFNEYCVRHLAGGGTGRGVDAGPTLAHARRVIGPNYVGAILHGSWARGEARDSSDIDVLVVVDRRVALSRALYATWDEAAPSQPDRNVDVHFVHPPAATLHPGAVWCEAALDGVVLDDPSGVITRALYDVRRSIAEGRVVRRSLHGQFYWTSAA